MAETNDVGLFEAKIDPLGQADLYAKVTVAGQPFTEAMQLDKSSVNPDWTTLHFVRNHLPTVPIQYQLWDEDGGVRGDDDHIDINPKAKVRDLNFSLNVSNHALSGDLTGIHDSAATAVTSTGKKSDSDRATVQLYVTEKALNP